MKKIVIIALFIISAVSLFGQNSSILQKTWGVSEITINDVKFEEHDGSCMYETELTMFKNGDFIVLKPCSTNSTKGIYKLEGNVLFLNDEQYIVNKLTYNELIVTYKTYIESNDFKKEVTVVVKYVVKYVVK